MKRVFILKFGKKGYFILYLIVFQAISHLALF